MAACGSVFVVQEKAFFCWCCVGKQTASPLLRFGSNKWTSTPSTSCSVEIHRPILIRCSLSVCRRAWCSDFHVVLGKGKRSVRPPGVRLFADRMQKKGNILKVLLFFDTYTLTNTHIRTYRNGRRERVVCVLIVCVCVRYSCVSLVGRECVWEKRVCATRSRSVCEADG